ncbi:unnamed protein product [Cuscuta campestris]|uniref:BED-type domain-containing protein n=1 Tax=Cuscuta campestris TaxID=132261 RepID=A0A484L484_9ASTE|nr:unnamed protein product [Cuscuta campestris]
MVKSRIEQGQSSSSKKESKDPAWPHGTRVNPPNGKSGYVYVKCHHCNKVITGGISRLKDHLAGTRKNSAPCPKVSDPVKKEMLALLKCYAEQKHIKQKYFDEMVDSGAYFGAPNDVVLGTGPNPRGPMDRFLGRCGLTSEDGSNKEGDALPLKMTKASVREQRNLVCHDVGRFIFENAISFNVANSPSYYAMMRAVSNYGAGFKPPSMHELRTWILKAEYDATNDIVEEVKKTWTHTGVTIMSDGWSDTRNRGLINILVNNQFGTIFLRSVDASDKVKDADYLFQLLDGIVEEIGEEIVVQVVTDNASAYKAAGNC